MANFTAEQITIIILIFGGVVAYFTLKNEMKKNQEQSKEKDIEKAKAEQKIESTILQIQKDQDGLGLKVRDLQADHSEIIEAHGTRINEIEKQNALTNQKLDDSIGKLDNIIEMLGRHINEGKK